MAEDTGEGVPQLPQPQVQQIPQCAFRAWKFAKYFQFQQEKNNNISVLCKLCLPAKKCLSSSKDSTSNLKKHLQVRYYNSLSSSRPPSFPIPLHLSWRPCCIMLSKLSGSQSASRDSLGSFSGSKLTHPGLYCL